MNNEKLNSSKEENQSNVEKVLGSMPEFSEGFSVVHKINRIVGEGLRQPLSVDSAKDILCAVNGAINGIEKSEIVEYGENAGQGDLIAPNKMIRKNIADEYVKAINNNEDEGIKAKLAYYAIINMHLFEDGNGRTSRAFYLMLKNGRLADADAFYLEHGKDGKGNSEFEEQNGLESADRIDNLALYKTIEKGVEDKEFPEWVGGWIKENGIFSINAYKEPDQGELEKIGLNEDERKVLYDACQDVYLMGYATLKLLINEGVDDSLFEMNTLAPLYYHDPEGDTMIAPKRISFTHSRRNMDRYNSVYGNMTADRYRKLINIYNSLKIEQNKKVIEIVQFTV